MARASRLQRWIPWLLGMLCLLACATALAKGSKYALIIGNAAYGGADNLTTPDNDARLLAKTLQNLGFTVELHTDRTRHEFLRDLDEFTRNAHSAAVVVFYYAGHGFEVGGDNFLMPVGLAQPLDRMSTTALRREGIAMRTVRAALAGTGARARILFMDACRTAPSRGMQARGMHKETASNGDGVLLAWSTGPGSAAVDSMRSLGRPINHSPFAWYLAHDLADQPSGIIQVLRRVQQQVTVATGNSQRPWFTSGLVGDLRMGAPVGSDTAIASAGALPTNVTTRGVNARANTAARRLWDREEAAIVGAQRSLDAPKVKLLKRRAAAGDSRAAVILGDAYASGNVVSENGKRAVHYYHQAARAGYIPGKTRVGEVLFAGRFLPRNLSAAERLLKTAADAGQTRAMLDLAQLRGVRGDANATQTYRKAFRRMGASFIDLMKQRSQKIQQAGKAQPAPAGTSASQR